MKNVTACPRTSAPGVRPGFWLTAVTRGPRPSKGSSMQPRETPGPDVLRRVRSTCRTLSPRVLLLAPSKGILLFVAAFASALDEPFAGCSTVAVRRLR